MRDGTQSRSLSTSGSRTHDRRRIEPSTHAKRNGKCAAHTSRHCALKYFTERFAVVLIGLQVRATRSIKVPNLLRAYRVRLYLDKITRPHAVNVFEECGALKVCRGIAKKEPRQ